MSENRIERRLAAIVAADVTGYSRLMGIDEEGTLAALKAHRAALVDPKIAEHRGRIVKTTGDGLLVEFASVIDATRCAVEVQTGMAERNAQVPAGQRVEFRLGIHAGDIIIDNDDIFGDDVNVAARLESVAEPGGINVSGLVRDQVGERLGIAFFDLGELSLKNIARPVRAFRILLGGTRIIDTSAPLSGPKPLELPNQPSIAVLPFHNMSADPEQQFFADGMVEDITTALSRIKCFFVIARNSSFAYKGKGINVKQVGKELGVRYVLEGSVRRFGDRVRITAQLVDAGTGNQIWAERYDRELSDIFAVQDEITASVVATIEPHLYAAEKLRIEGSAPESLDAWGCVVRGLWHLGRLEPSDNLLAKDLLVRAISISPRYAKAHALLGWCTARHAVLGQEAPGIALPAAMEFAQTALTLDWDDPWSHFALGGVQFLLRRTDESVHNLQQAVNLNPNFAFAYTQLGGALIFGGRHDEGFAALDRSMRISPRDPFNALALWYGAMGHFLAGRLKEAEACAEASLRQRPNFPPSLRILAAFRAERGSLAEAKALLAEADALEQTKVPSEVFAKRLAFTRTADVERFLAAMQKTELEPTPAAGR